MGKKRLRRRAYALRDLARRMSLFLKGRSRILKTAAVITVIAAALLFFGGNGEESPVNILRKGAEESFAISYENEQKAGKSEAIVKKQQSEVLICCDIGGAVSDPGIYFLPEGSRLYELIDMAGGLSEGADTSGINRAAVLSDGAMIRIPLAGEEPIVSIAGDTGYGGQSGTSAGPVNINTAGIEELQTVPGIGPVIAGRIVDYREKMGPFGSIEEIMSVKGIGEKTFDKIKSHICC